MRSRTSDAGGGNGLASRMLGALRVPGLLLGAPPRADGAVVLAYHDVGTGTRTASHVAAGMLRRHLEALRRWRLRFVDLGELVGTFSSAGALDGMVAVTFDDAWEGVHNHALPVLLELGVPATLFVSSAMLAQTPPWAPAGVRTMTAAEVVEVARAGLRIGSHGRTHVDLPSLDDAGLAAEVAGSRASLEDLVGQPVDHLAYPYGHHDARVRAAVAGAGYAAGFTFLNGRVTAGLDPFRLPRLTMGSHHHPVRFAYHLARPASSWPDHQLDRVSAAAS